MTTATIGTMKGTVEIYTATDVLIRTYNFETSEVKRYQTSGLEASGFMVSEGASISFGFVDRDQPSGHFPLPSLELTSLMFHPEFGHANAAVSGEVVLQNHAPRQIINGRLCFTTEYRNSRFYKVDVIFDIHGIDSEEAPQA